MALNNNALLLPAVDATASLALLVLGLLVLVLPMQGQRLPVAGAHSLADPGAFCGLPDLFMRSGEAVQMSLGISAGASSPPGCGRGCVRFLPSFYILTWPTG
jgi:hypothetical protein